MAVAVLVNGSPAPVVSIHDRGLAFGDGVFRTMRMQAGRPLNWQRHYRRLVHDCLALDLPKPGEALLLAEAALVAPADAVVKMTVTRGQSERGYAFPDEVSATRIVAAHPLPGYPAELARDGVRVRWCELVAAEQPRLAGAKTLNRLESVLARSEWSDPDIREGLLCDASGRLVGGTMTNVFLARGGSLATPALVRCGVAGAQRERVLDLARDAGIRCDIRDVGIEEVAAADEVFLTNSLIGIWPVGALDAHAWTRFPLANRFQKLVAEDDARAP